MPLPLIALFIAAFAFGTTEFVIAGVLPQVADGLDVSVPTAGYLVSGYAMGIAIGGPLLTLATARLSRRRCWSACTSPSRRASRLRAGARFRLHAVHPRRRRGRPWRLFRRRHGGGHRPGARGPARHGGRPDPGRLTVSNIIGVPAGTAIGNIWGWRATFWAMFGLGLVANDRHDRPSAAHAGLRPPPAGLKKRGSVLGRQQVWTSLILMLMLMIGQFVPFTYIAPLLQEVTGLDAGLVPWVLLLNGVGATIGVFIGGKLADWKLMPSLIAMLALQAVVLAVDLCRQPLSLADGVGDHRLGRPQLRHRHADPDPHPRLDGRRAQPRLLAHPVRLQCRDRAGRLRSAPRCSMPAIGYRSLPVLGVAAMIVAVAVAVASYMTGRGAAARPRRCRRQPQQA